VVSTLAGLVEAALAAVAVLAVELALGLVLDPQAASTTAAAPAASSAVSRPARAPAPETVGRLGRPWSLRMVLM
jgi:hypothetical protein